MPPVGWNVVFYNQADPTSEPVPATITRSMTDGMVSLNVQPVLLDGELRSKRLVYHISDTRLKDNGPLASRFGGWDYIVGHAYRPPQAIKAKSKPKVEPEPSSTPEVDEAPKETKEERRARINDRILVLHNSGYSPSEIVHTVKESGVTTSYVTKAINAVQEPVTTS